MRWQELYPAMLRKFEQDLPDLLSFLQFRQHLWRKLSITNVIERCFVEVRRRTAPISSFSNSDSCQRIIYGVIAHVNRDRKPLPNLHKYVDTTQIISRLTKS